MNEDIQYYKQGICINVFIGKNDVRNPIFDFFLLFKIYEFRSLRKWTYMQACQLLADLSIENKDLNKFNFLPLTDNLFNEDSTTLQYRIVLYVRKWQYYNKFYSIIDNVWVIIANGTRNYVIIFDETTSYFKQWTNRVY